MLISFSGIDCSGKSTQIEKVSRYFNEKNRVKIIWSRGGYTVLFNFIKSILRKSSVGVLPESGNSLRRSSLFKKKIVIIFWIYLSLIDLFMLYAIIFRLLSFFGYVVIADRYIWDTYIDFKIKFSNDDFKRTFFWKLLLFCVPKPDYSFILKIPAEESLRRSKLKNEPFSEDINDRLKRIELYNKLMKKDKWDIRIDGMDPIHKVWCNIKKYIE